MGRWTDKRLVAAAYSLNDALVISSPPSSTPSDTGFSR